MSKKTSPLPLKYLWIVQLVVVALGVFTLIDFIKSPNTENAFMLAGEVIVLALGFNALSTLKDSDDKA